MRIDTRKYRAGLPALFCSLGILAICSCRSECQPDRIILYNGIVLPEVWPPRYDEPSERYPMPVPYLESKPNVIPVNVGRQLFVDDYIVAETDMEMVSHTPVYYPGNPIIEPTEGWEKTVSGSLYAAPFSDGIWFDELDNKFKMWYLTGASHLGGTFCTAYAESVDGKHWTKPVKDIVQGTNIVDTCDRDAATVWLDKEEPDSCKRFKFFNVERDSMDGRWQFVLKYSADGIHWSEGVAQSGEIYDRSSVFYNPFRKVWGVSMRHPTPVSRRSRAYLEATDPEMAVSLAHRPRKGTMDKNVVIWFSPDNMEPRHPDYPQIDPGIYHFDCIPYESIMLGQYSVWQGPENQDCKRLGIQKRNEVLLGYSRDGFHFSRPSHRPFLGVHPEEGSWNWGNVQSVCGVPLIVGDSLFFYVSGRRLNDIMWDSYSSCGLATLRRDGFVSRHAGKTNRTLTTETLTFKGKYLFVNAEVNGAFQVEILSNKGRVLKQSTLYPAFNSTKKRILDVSRFSGKKVQLRFTLRDGDLYAFWISPWKSGESLGFTAGGGPGLSPDGIDQPTGKTSHN